MFHFAPLVYFVVAAILLVLGIWVLSRVREDYRGRERLAPPTAIIQTGYFCLYALSSYLFLDSRISSVRTDPITFIPALVLSGLGLAIVILSMPALGPRSFGHEVGELRTIGLYRYSRNPQLVGGLLLVLGYALLWPSWQGLLWAALWIPIAILMVQAEEEHLSRVFGDQYTVYCRKTPRFVGRRRD